MKAFLFSLCMMASLCLSSQSEDLRNLDAFNAIEVNGPITVELYQGDKHEVSIDVKNISIDDVITKVSSGNLIIELKKKNRRNWYENIDVLVKVTFEDLEEIEASAASSVYAETIIKTDELEIDLTAASNCDLEVACEKVYVDLSAASSLNIEGNTDFLEVDINGASSYKGYDLEAIDANVDADSASSAKVYVTGRLNASASSVSTINYKGDPKETNIDKSSMASINKR